MLWGGPRITLRKQRSISGSRKSLVVILPALAGGGITVSALGTRRDGWEDGMRNWIQVFEIDSSLRSYRDLGVLHPFLS